MPKRSKAEFRDLQPGDILSENESRYVTSLQKLWDMISDAIEGGRLNEANMPDDYDAFVRKTTDLNRLYDKIRREDDEEDDDGEK